MTDDYYAKLEENKYFKWLPVGSSIAIPNDELEGVCNPQILISHSVDKMVLALKAYVLTDHLETFDISQTKIATEQVPATWWDHFKLTYQDKWWLPRRLKKVNYKKIEIPISFNVKVEPRMMFPRAQVRYPRNFGEPYRIVTYHTVR